MSDYRNILDYLRVLEERIDELSPYEIVYCITLDTTFLKKTVKHEIDEWRQAIAGALKTQASLNLKEITNFLEEQGKVLTIPADNVENAKKILVAVDLIHDKQVDEDQLIGPIEVGIKYNLIPYSLYEIDY